MEEEIIENELIQIEQKILSSLTSYKSQFVSISTSLGKNEKIWTVSLNTESDNTPLVLLHGFAAGIGFWILNLEPLSKDRPVYAIDILGFSRSSRPEFSENSCEAEDEMVEALEAWRKEIKLEKFILLGHSMGAYFSALYAMSYPDCIQHLIFADAWGFTDKYENPDFLLKTLIFIFGGVNPIGCLRALGPYYGPLLLQKTRRDIFGNFAKKVGDDSLLPQYVYYCNALKDKSTGEKAFYSMVSGIGWSKNPIIKRIDKLKTDLSISLLYGSNSWMDITMGPKFKDLRPNSFVDFYIIENAGHHIYSEQADDFNEKVRSICKLSDGRRS